MLDYIKNNKTALFIALMAMAFYSYYSYNGRVCFQCLTENKWEQSYGNNRHK